MIRSILFKNWTCKFASKKDLGGDKYQNFILYSQKKFGDLSTLTKILGEQGANLTYVQTQYDHEWRKNKKYILDISLQRLSDEKIKTLKTKLQSKGIHLDKKGPIKIPWLPLSMDGINETMKIDYKSQVVDGHFAFQDHEYKKKRDQIAEIANNYRMQEQIPDVQYSKEETAFWKQLYANLSKYHKEGMCKQYNQELANLNKQFNLSERIPQLSEINKYLYKKTGFRFKPTHSIVGPRQFLNCFAFRIFPVAQYLRHPKTSILMPQIDILHEIIGHVPMLCDLKVADIAQRVGRLTLGADEDQLIKASNLYWYTIQYGVCLQNGKKVGYGGGIGSNITELQHLLSNQAKFKKFEPSVDCYQPFTRGAKKQDLYRISQTFQKTIDDLGHYGQSIRKPIYTTYDQKTEQMQYNRQIICTSDEEKASKM